MADNPQQKSPLRPHNGLLILIGVCLFLLLISSFSPAANNAIRSAFDTVLMPMQRGMNRAGRHVFEWLENVRDLSAVQEVNEELREELGMLREENARLKVQLQELEELQELISLRKRYPEYPMIGANVIGKSSGNWYSSFLIDKGTNDGLEVNMNVIAQGGLVGIITSVGDSYATVTAIINDGQYVSAMNARSGEKFLVAGDLLLYRDARIGLQEIPLDSNLGPGDTVVTSATSELYLPGLLIGTVDSVSMGASQLLKEGTLLPAVNFDEIGAVLVITQLKVTGE